jgi:hypothetical protein
MSQPTLKSFVEQVLNMRLAQQRYFQASAKSRKTRHTEDLKMTSEALKKAKGLETAVDQTIKSVLGIGYSIEPYK